MIHMKFVLQGNVDIYQRKEVLIKVGKEDGLFLKTMR